MAAATTAGRSRREARLKQHGGGRMGAFVVPATVVLVLAFLAPLLAFAALGFEATDEGGFLAHYGRVLQDGYNRTLLLRTVKLASLTTAYCLLLAIPVALYVRQASARARSVVTLILLAPLMTSVVVRVLGWVVLLAPRGIAYDIAEMLGLQDRLPVLLYTDAAVVMGLTHVYLGFMALSVMTSILKIDDNVIAAARNLGATSTQLLRHIVWPLARPGVAAGCVIVFALSASAYVAPAMLGGSRSQTLATRIYQVAIVYLEWGQAAALAGLLFLIIGLAAFLITGWERSRR